ncbi:MAG: hypothetical protein H6668_18250 [Ardenticatenaceae bacterium]|nr:hypothetical protein [Ardenticatenaceae bacterium]
MAWQCLAAAVATPAIAASGNGDVAQLDGWGDGPMFIAPATTVFTPSTAYASGVGSSWSDGGVGQPGSKLCPYHPAPAAGCGESANSQRLGRSDFVMVPGS